MSCKEHPKYTAVRRPQASCIRCWKMYLEQHAERTMKASDLLGVIRALEWEQK